MSGQHCAHRERAGAFSHCRALAILEHLEHLDVRLEHLDVRLECGMQPLSQDDRLLCPITNEWYGIASRARSALIEALVGRRCGRVPVPVPVPVGARRDWAAQP